MFLGSPWERNIPELSSLLDVTNAYPQGSDSSLELISELSCFHEVREAMLINVAQGLLCCMLAGACAFLVTMGQSFKKISSVGAAGGTKRKSQGELMRLF